MSLIQVTPELLEEKAREIRGLKEQHEGIIQNLTSQVQSLQSEYKGAGADAYYSKYEELKPTFNKLTETLEGLAAKLESNARIMREVDAETAR